MLTSTTANVARFGTLGARGLQLQTAAFTRGPTTGSCPYSSLVASSLAKSQCSTSQQKSFSSNSSLKSSPRKSSSPSQCRFTTPTTTTTTTTPRRQASTTAPPSSSNPTPTPTPTSSSTSPPPPQEPLLDWNTFFRLRKTRRRIQLASSMLTTAAGGGTGALLLVNQDLEWLLGKIPMDPIFSLGLLTMACAGLGWLAGPSLGSVLFHLLRRGVKRPMAAKEAEFFARIKKNRVDPTTSSVQNPVPDFYGEKISSVAGYRQWMKDQRAFTKKRTIV